MNQHISFFACLALFIQTQISVEAADKCLKVETVQDLDLDAFISKPWYGTLQKKIVRYL
jgi:hypothetical protein